LAEHKDYGLVGVGRNLQLGKQGPQLKHNGDNTVSVTDVSGSTLTTVSGANASQATHFVTKAQLDNVKNAEATLSATITHNSSTITLGIIPAGSKTIIATLTVNTVFDGTADISVGTDANQSLLVGNSYNDPTLKESFQTVTTVELAEDATIKVYPTFTSSTQGNATIVVSYY
jgi:hypothetical protein